MNPVFFKPWVGAEYASGGIFGTRIKAAPVKHPSAGYTWENWYKFINQFLNK